MIEQPNSSHEWRQYWIDCGTPWRTQPEIDTVRQTFLEERRRIRRDISRNIYPFGGVTLTRADVEWLLATHDSGRGPIDWDSSEDRKRRGVDLHGADLQGVNLRYLPLSNTILGLTREEWWHSDTIVNPEKYATHLERADLQLVHLEGAALRFAHLENADPLFANMRGAELRSAILAGANLERAILDSASALVNITLADEAHGAAYLTDVAWGETNMALLDWTKVTVIGEETRAAKQKKAMRQRTKKGGDKPTRKDVVAAFQLAVRGYRQLAAQLRQQGLRELADQYSYRALVIQRKVYRMQRRWSAVLGSTCLDILAGYGFRPLRSFVVYLFFVTGFGALYWAVAQQAGIPLNPLEALIFSITSFHGRGFTPIENISLDNPLTILAAGEAMMGLIVEITFIATFTQRYFGHE